MIVGKFIKSHPNYLAGFIVWLAAIGSLLFFPTITEKLKLFDKDCESCKKYDDFLKTLSIDQKERLSIYEGAGLEVGGKYYLVGVNSKDEFNLYRKNILTYKEMPVIEDEKIRRSIIINSILKSMSAEERELVFIHRAAILYRDGKFILVGNSGDTVSME